ncbi:unnamed protein product [Knipowitschia caucasica]|uniref:Lipocalin/cytosolic fatty-acid binding domain-containing protein n=1 Tax=Knipowitschia caucasica TaxID=637954 RepID=A0AAV2MQT8_KNICA
MFLQVLLFAPTLCFVRAEELGSEKQLVQDPRLVVGKWIVHAVGSNNITIFNRLQTVTSSWVMISKTDEEDKYHVQVHDKVGDTCYSKVGDAYLWEGGEVTLTLTGTPFNTKHKGVYLQTYSENAVVWLDRSYHQNGHTFITGKNIVLFKKSKVVADQTMQRFIEQAKCENIDIFDLPSTDLCAEQNSGTAE